MRTRGDTRTVADALAGFDEIDYVVVTAGSLDVLAEVVCDDDQLLDTAGRIRDVDGVAPTETFVHLGPGKQTHAWGLAAPRPRWPRTPRCSGVDSSA